jgi:hypothetical protein
VAAGPPLALTLSFPPELSLAAVRLRRMRRDLGDGYELDDDRERIDLDAVHAFISDKSYWAKGKLVTCGQR